MGSTYCSRCAIEEYALISKTCNYNIFDEYQLPNVISQYDLLSVYDLINRDEISMS